MAGVNHGAEANHADAQASFAKSSVSHSAQDIGQLAYRRKP
jgi:hypothetical protein